MEADPYCFTLHSRFPGGFTPQFGGDLIDYSVVAGLRQLSTTGLNWDVSINSGTSEVDQFIFDTVNASLGYDTPTLFEPGSYRQHDVNVNVDVSYPVSEMVNVAGGAEWRNEQFTIGAGGQPSWEIGPYAAQGFSSGSNGFNGYRAPTRRRGVGAAGTWRSTPHYSRVTELLVVQAFSSVMTQMDAGVMTIEAMRRPDG